MALSDFGLNPYVDLRTGTLHNLVGARSPDVLKERENTLVTLRIAELKESPVQGRLDFAHLKEIHHRLFQDVYQWAGETRADREFQGNKETRVTGYKEVMTFGPHQEIEARLGAIGEQLGKEN